jgi:polysaccharide export outer membrane protein
MQYDHLGKKLDQLMEQLGRSSQSERVPQFDHPIEAGQYIIRPGDELTVSFLKANIEPLRLTVDPEGRIIHGNLGLFDLSNRTLSQVREELTGAFKNLYKVENIVISISNPLAVRISITGAVDTPGVYSAYTSQRISDAIKLAGGILPDGSSRNIIFRGGPHNILVDLDRAEYTGDLKADPCLYAGFTIHVPQKSNSRIQIFGEVNNPREIELQDDDNLHLLIELAGGLRNWADSNNIQIIRDGNFLNALIEPILPGDIIKVNPLVDIPIFQAVFIFGAVLNPGKFQKEDVPSLAELLNIAGGFDEKAARLRTTVFRFNPVDAAGRISTSRTVIQNIYADKGPGGAFTLAGGDSVFVPFYVGYVEVAGDVVNPGIFPFQPGQTAEFYINSAGGYLSNVNPLEIDTYDPVAKLTSRNSPKIQIQDGCKLTVNIRRGLE